MGQLESYEGFCSKFPWWNFHLICAKQEIKTVLRQESPELADRIDIILRECEPSWGDLIPKYYPQFYEAYKILHEKDPSDRFIPRTALDADGRF